MDFKDVSEKEPLNVNILCDTNFPYSNYYLYRFIFYWFLLFYILKNFIKYQKKYKERISKIKIWFHRNLRVPYLQYCFWENPFGLRQLILLLYFVLHFLPFLAINIKLYYNVS